MRSTCLLFNLFVCGFLLLLSCVRPESRIEPETKTTTESPMGYRKLLEWDVPPSPQGQRNGLQGIAADHQGNVYVADAEGRRVLVYSAEGNILRTIEPDTRHSKILQRPFGLLFDGRGRLYITDYDADQIQVFNSAGKFLFAWGREGKGKGEFRAPVAVDQDRKGNIYVVEFYGMRVQKFTDEGRFLLTWGSEAPWGKPAPPEQLLYPSGLAVGPDDNIYVTDSGHDRIKIFDANGKFLREWGRKGVEPGELNAAAGIGFDSGGRLHEADSAMHRVQMFTTEGKFLREWVIPNAGKLNVWSPTNLRPVGSGILYVSDVAENKIYKLLVHPGPG